MGAPALAVQVQGQGTVSADNLNTFAQTTNVIADLRAFIGTSGVEVLVRGAMAVNDGQGGAFYWDPSAIGPDDNANIIIPAGVGVGGGGWVRVNSSATFNNSTFTGTAVLSGTLTLPAGGQISATGKIGIFTIPVNPLDIDFTLVVGNGAGVAELTNGSVGAAATAEWRFNNGQSVSNLKVLGPGYTPSGVFRSDGMMLQGNGVGGLTINTGVSQPVYVGVNNTQVAVFTASGLTVKGQGVFGDGNAAGAVSARRGSLGIGGILDLAVNSGGGGWSGILVAQNGDPGNFAIRTEAVYAICARGTDFSATQLATADGGTGAAAFGLSCPSNGVIRLTNAYGSPSQADMVYWGSFLS